MKRAIVILGAAIALVGCDKPQGSSSDTYNTDQGAGRSSSTNSSSGAVSPGSINSPTPTSDSTGSGLRGDTNASANTNLTYP